MSDRFNCIIEIICPVHIGCDEIYDPTGFLVDEENDQIIAFDPLSFVSGLTPEDKVNLSRICSEGTITSLLKIYRFFRGKKVNGRAVALASGFVDHYRKTLDLKREEEIRRELNRFVVFRTSFLPMDNRPYIPGSALKGAIRTAYLNLLAKEERAPLPKGKAQARELEKALLGGSFDSDPFRFVKVSDFMPIGAVRARILYAVNEKKKPSRFEARGPFQILETIEVGSRFLGTINVEVPHPKAGIRAPISLHNLLKATEDFYGKEKGREDGELRSIGARLADYAPLQGQHLLRLGRHSGAECVTIERFRDIKIMKARGEKIWDKHSTTLWLASEVSKPKTKEHLRPFGWAVLREMTQDDFKEFEIHESEWEDEIRNCRSPIGPTVTPIQAPLGQKQPPATPPPAQREMWENAMLTFRPNDGSIVASSGTKKAQTKDKTLVPEALRKKLFDKRKPVTSAVEVEKFGNAFLIVGIK